MKRIWTIVTTLAVLMMLTSTLSFADMVEYFRGRVVEMRGSRLVVGVNGSSTKTFEITDKTIFLRSNVPFLPKKLLPGSLVKVMAASGKAEAVYIEEVPK